MSRRVVILLLIFSLAANGAAATALGVNWYRAQREEPAFTWQGKHVDRFFREDLGVREDKIHKLRQVLAPRGPQMRRMRDGIREHRMHLVELIAQPEPDRASIEREIAEIAALQSRMEWEAVERLLSVKAQLTPEEQGRLYELLQTHACGGMMRGHERGMGRGGPRHRGWR